MITSQEKQILRANIEKYEGKVSHMYLDSRGLVTVGIGHLITNVAEAQKLAFETANHAPATGAEIKTDYEAVKKQPANRIASFYKRFTKLLLSDVEINKLTDKHILAFEGELKRIYSGFESFPSEVRLALFDIIFNVGMTDLKNNWPNFNAAIQAKDWQTAANESSRAAPISAERNRYVKTLLERAAHNSTAQPVTP